MIRFVSMGRCLS